DPNESKFLAVLGKVVMQQPAVPPSLPPNYQEAFGIAATSDPFKMVFTDREKEETAFGTIQADPSQTQFTAQAYPLELNSSDYYLNVNNPEGVAITRDLKYAFVAAYNKYFTLVNSHNPYYGGIPSGSTIGIIKDPFTNPTLVAATRPIPLGFAHDVALSADG